MFAILFSLLFTTAFATTYNCETTYDQLNIPHVKTSSMEDFYYCFGLNHGQDRAWEMDYFRRVGQGRNAEILGFSQLKSDLMMRLLELPKLADKLWSNFPADKKKWIELYAQGVNKGFETGKNAKEFKDKNFSPEEWKPEHTILVLLLQSFDQTRKSFFRDYEEEKSKSKWKERASVLFDEDGMPWENTILKSGEYEEKENIVKTTSYEHRPINLWGDFPSLFGRESGSNNWVVSKAKSKSGKAILANDPHLDLKTPMFWYWISLKSPDAQVIGGSVPGVPVVAAGTNGKVSWGLTNSYLNAADAVLVKDLKDTDLDTLWPTVKVKLWFMEIPFFFKKFEKLKTGHPVLPLDIDSDDKLVLRWTGYGLTPEEIIPMFDLFKAKDVTEMDKLISQIGIPSWNFVFADTKGDVGYRLVGKTFKNTEKNPYGVPSMKLQDFLNVEFLAATERPHVLKPARNYVYSANNRHWPKNSKYYGGRGYSHSYRGFRIDELLKDNKHDVESFKSIQCDRQVVDARFFLPKLQKYLDVPEFKSWSMLADDGSKVLPLYRRTMDIAMEKWEVNEYALFKLLDELDNKGRSELKEFFAAAQLDIKGKTWGDLHRVNFPHMSKNETWAFSPEIPGIGDTHSVDPGTSKWNPDRGVYEQNSGASMRMIVEMDEVPKIWLALPGVNRKYESGPDQTPWLNWKNCRYSEVKF